ncbi:hypothetical protein D557_1983 [Bordetella holmesii 70147]|nr:hypothetical protein D557_1983 [Bordetella holmesii 70147]
MAGSLQQAGGNRSLSGAQDQVLAVEAAEFGAMRVRNNGNQALFVEFDVQGTPRTAPVARNDVITLQRRWYRPDGTAWDGGLLQTGDMLVVRIQADANQYVPDALIVDRVPAGFEVENLNLSQSPALQDWQIGGREVAQAKANPISNTGSFATTAMWPRPPWVAARSTSFIWRAVVTPGRYSVPAVVAEDMYRPELRGVGDTWSSIEIRDRQPGK